MRRRRFVDGIMLSASNQRAPVAAVAFSVAVFMVLWSPTAAIHFDIVQAPQNLSSSSAVVSGHIKPYEVHQFYIELVPLSAGDSANGVASIEADVFFNYSSHFTLCEHFDGPIVPQNESEPIKGATCSSCLQWFQDGCAEVDAAAFTYCIPGEYPLTSRRSVRTSVRRPGKYFYAVYLDTDSGEGDLSNDTIIEYKLELESSDRAQQTLVIGVYGVMLVVYLLGLLGVLRYADYLYPIDPEAEAEAMATAMGKHGQTGITAEDVHETSSIEFEIGSAPGDSPRSPQTPRYRLGNSMHVEEDGGDSIVQDDGDVEFDAFGIEQGGNSRPTNQPTASAANDISHEKTQGNLKSSEGFFELDEEIFDSFVEGDPAAKQSKWGQVKRGGRMALLFVLALTAPAYMFKVTIGELTCMKTSVNYAPDFYHFWLSMALIISISLYAYYFRHEFLQPWNPSRGALLLLLLVSLFGTCLCGYVGKFIVYTFNSRQPWTWSVSYTLGITILLSWWWSYGGIVNQVRRRRRLRAAASSSRANPSATTA